MTNDDDAGEFDATMDDPIYQLLAAIADMYVDSGYGLDADPQTAGGWRLLIDPQFYSCKEIPETGDCNK